MKLSERIIEEMGAWPRTSSLCRVLDECLTLAKRYEDAPVRTVLYLNQAGGLVCYVSLPESMAGQRVRIVLDKEG